jgi:hypothetical protein
MNAGRLRMRLVRRSEASLGGAVMYLADFTVTACVLNHGKATVVTRDGDVATLHIAPNSVWLNQDAVQVTEEAEDEAR